MVLSGQFVQAFGTASMDLIGANVCDWITGATGNIIDLRGFASNLRADATTAINNAATAQTTANGAQSTATSALAVATGKPSISQIPVGSALWAAINNDEDSTFPRSQLSFGAASGTSSGGSTTANPHTHGLGAVPDYKPAGNGNDFLEIGYIRTAKDRSYTTIGFITGNSATWAGINAAYVGVFSVNTTTGALTLLNTATATTDISGSITTTNTEQRFSMGYTINAHQNDVYAVGLLQVTSAIQTCASLMKTTLTDLNPPVVQYPRKNYCYYGSTTTIPSTIAESNLNYSASDKLPFYVLR